MKSIEEALLSGKRVLVRVDLNVPMEGQKIRDTYRLHAAFPTLEFLLNRNAKVILMAHLGQPKTPEEYQSLAPVYTEFSKLLERPIQFEPKLFGEITSKSIDQLKGGEIIGLENLRSDAGERNNSRTFARRLAAYGEIYVNDAFSESHREVASISAVTEFLPSYAGLLFEQEFNVLSHLLRHPASPFVVIIGGAKIEDKLPVIKKLLDRADRILVGGGVANTFLAAQGLDVKKSLVNRDFLDQAKSLLRRGRGKIILPTDFAYDEEAIVDIGDESAKKFVRYIDGAHTVFWNGNLGKSEKKCGVAGSRAVAEAMSKSGATTIIAGGNTIDLCNQLGLTRDMSFVSSGGGATLRFLSGDPMPGVTALEQASGRE